MKKTKKDKKSVLELTQVDGKQEKFVPTKLSQIWGDDGLSKYKTFDSSVYESELKGMNLSDLQREAIKIGIIPNMQRDRLVRQLLVEFNKYTNLYRKPSTSTEKLDPSKVKQALDILSRVK